VTWLAKSYAVNSGTNLTESEKKTGTKDRIIVQRLFLPLIFLISHLQYEIPKISSIKLVQIESKIMSGGCMVKNSSQSRASSLSSMFNGEVKILDYWCPRRCVARKANTLKNP
jgi:hypothetical protein